MSELRRAVRMGLRERHRLREGWSDPSRLLALVVWGAFIVFPVFDAATDSTREPRYVLTLAAAVVFSALYCAQVFDWEGEPMTRVRDRAQTGTMLAIAIVLTASGGQGWGYLFCYVAGCGAFLGSERSSMVWVCGAAFIGVGVTLTVGSAGEAIGYGASALGVGLLVSLMRDLRVRNLELCEARAELARTAVTAERERFARDLHDLLGHSLSVIAIKAELAGRLLPIAPERAAAEVADLESVARTALSEVREAVSGYRRPTLDGELEGARVAFAAAGIVAEFERLDMTLPPEVEAVLAWAVREGATNVIRHSGAGRCEVRVRSGGEGAEVVVQDDGAPTPPTKPSGNGLAGLRERATALRGELEAGAVAGGGFRLAVTVPLSSGEVTG